VPGRGKHLGAMVVTLRPNQHPTEYRLLSDALSPTGELDPGDLYWTSLVKAPPDGLPTTDSQVEAGIPYLAEEVQHVVPRFVLALGAQVFRALTGSPLAMPLYRGMWTRLDDPFDWDEGLVMATWSPEEALSLGGYAVAAFRRDVGEFVRAWRKGMEPAPQPRLRPGLDVTTYP
jgi:uracil-DNA glycosylase